MVYASKCKLISVKNYLLLIQISTWTYKEITYIDIVTTLFQVKLTTQQIDRN